MLAEILAPNGYKLPWLIFSLVLAIIPIGWTLLLSHIERKKKFHGKNLIFGLVLFFWFIFFPNIPYLFTKGRYLLDFCGSKSPWDVCDQTWLIGYFFLHAAIGLPLMVKNLYQTSLIVGRQWHSPWKIALPLITIPISALAILVGLHSRLNSWIIFIHPQQLYTWLSNSLTTPRMVDWIMWTLILFLLYNGGLYFFREKQAPLRNTS